MFTLCWQPPLEITGGTKAPPMARDAPARRRVYKMATAMPPSAASPAFGSHDNHEAQLLRARACRQRAVGAVTLRARSVTPLRMSQDGAASTHSGSKNIRCRYDAAPRHCLRRGKTRQDEICCVCVVTLRSAARGAARDTCCFCRLLADGGSSSGDGARRVMPRCPRDIRHAAMLFHEYYAMVSRRCCYYTLFCRYIAVAMSDGSRNMLKRVRDVASPSPAP